MQERQVVEGLLRAKQESEEAIQAASRGADTGEFDSYESLYKNTVTILRDFFGLPPDSAAAQRQDAAGPAGETRNPTLASLRTPSAKSLRGFMRARSQRSGKSVTFGSADNTPRLSASSRPSSSGDSSPASAETVTVQRGCNFPWLGRKSPVIHERPLVGGAEM
jgi:hypothetical protein